MATPTVSVSAHDSAGSTDSDLLSGATTTHAVHATILAAPVVSASASNGSLGALNVPVFPGGLPCAVTPRFSSALDVALGINTAILSLYGEHVTSDGKGVNYGAMVASPAFVDYVQTTAQLQFVALDALAPQELKAFVLNIYNALVIHAIAVRGAADTTVSS